MFHMTYQATDFLNDLDPSEYVVVDVETGTVVGVNLRVIHVSDVPQSVLAALDEGSDSEIIEAAEEYGYDLLTALD